jgi:hypothetical protein
LIIDNFQDRNHLPPAEWENSFLPKLELRKEDNPPRQPAAATPPERGFLYVPKLEPGKEGKEKTV